jgi:hypothetical protein
MEAFVDVTYRGLELGRGLKLCQVGPSTAYLEHGTPMPVGAQIMIETSEGVVIAAEVVRVYEQVAGAEMPPGMRLRAHLEGEAAAWWEKLVSRQDPCIPEQAAPPAPESVAEEVTEVAAVPGSESSAAGWPAEDDKRTEVMDAVDPAVIEAAMAGDGEGDTPARGGNGETRRTQVMTVEQIREAIGGEPIVPGVSERGDDSGSSDGAGPNGPNGDSGERAPRGKTTRRRRGRKK